MVASLRSRFARLVSCFTGDFSIDISAHAARLGRGIVMTAALLLTCCNIYSSSDRKTFNSSGSTSSHSASAKLSLDARTDCKSIDNASVLLFRGVDIVHATEAWNVEPGEAPGSYRFVWARRSERIEEPIRDHAVIRAENRAGNRADAVLCVIQPIGEYELQRTLETLPSIAQHISAQLQ